MSSSFAQLGVPSFVCDALARRDITEPFAIQAATIADMLAGRDICGRAPTGSGKTIAFGVPVVTNTRQARPGFPQALILAPTRELAEQITTELRTFGGRLRIEAVYGGVGYGGQLKALKRGVDVLVACPGRLEDLIERRDVRLDDVRCVVLDEADRMADMGFMPSVKRLLALTSPDRQTVLFSATLDGDVAKLTRDYQRDPVRHEVGPETPDVKAASHHFWKVDRDSRNAVLADFVKVAWPAVIFCRTRHGADRLVKQLGQYGVEGIAIHGGLGQNQRNRALESFSSGRVHAMVATDVAARGIHVDGVAAVVHYDPPEDSKAYVHRSGRTARAGATGMVLSLVQHEQLKDVRRMQREIGIDEQILAPDFTTLPLDGVDADRPLAAAAPAPAPTPAAARQARPPRRSNGRRNEPRRDEPREPRVNDWSPRPPKARRDDRTPARADDRTPRRDDRAPRSDARPARGDNRPQRGDGGRTESAGGTRTGTARPTRSGTGASRANRAARRAHLQPGAKR
jgi:superfamily II DNA/RNA helicase